MNARATAAVGGGWSALAAAATLGALLLAVMDPGPRTHGLSVVLGDSAHAISAPRSYQGPATAFARTLVGRLLDRLAPPHAPATTTAPGRRLVRPASVPGTPRTTVAPPHPGADAPAPHDVRVDMTADRAEARPSDEIVYTITVANAGVHTTPVGRVTSLVPVGTILVAGPACGGRPASVTARASDTPRADACVGVPPPGGDDRAVRAATPALPPGAQHVVVFRVAIRPDTPFGAVIANRAVAEIPALAPRTSRDAVTCVCLPLTALLESPLPAEAVVVLDDRHGQRLRPILEPVTARG